MPGIRSVWLVISLAFANAIAAACILADVGFGLQPTGLPIELGWSSEAGWTLTVKSSIATPLGVLSGYASVSETRDAYPDTRLLVIRLAEKTFVYRLGSESYQLSVPNNIGGEVTISYDGKDVIVSIPHPDRIMTPRFRAKRRSVRMRVATVVVTMRSGQDVDFNPLRGPLPEGQRDVPYSTQLGWRAQGMFLRKRGWVALSSNVAGARASVGGNKWAVWQRQIATLPATVEVSAGDVYIVVSKHGCRPSEANVLVPPGQTVGIRVVLDCR